MTRSEIEVAEASVPGQQSYKDGSFPLVLECRTPSATLSEATEWLAGNAADLIGRAEAHGAVLFRGFPVATAEGFDAFVAAFGLPNFPYYESLSNAVRVNRTPRVFTANEAPPEVTIFLHHEMAQTPLPPAKLFFFCEQPAAEGGATPVCRSDVLWERLAGRHPDFARDCEVKGLRYSNVMPSADDPASGMGRSWQSTLRSTTRDEAEARLKTLGYAWEWLPDGCLRMTSPTLPAVRPLPAGGKHSSTSSSPPSRAGRTRETTPPRRSRSATAARSIAMPHWPRPTSAKSSRSTFRGERAMSRSSTITSRCTAGGRSPAPARCWPRSSRPPDEVPAPPPGPDRRGHRP